MVPSDYVAMNTVELVNVTIRIVLMFACIFVLVSVTAIFLLMRYQQRAALETEKKNNEILEKVNGELQVAVKKAEAASKEAEAASKAKSAWQNRLGRLTA